MAEGTSDFAVTHRDGPAGRLHEAVVVVRGTPRPVAVYHDDDVVGEELIRLRVAEIRAQEDRWEANGREFLEDGGYDPARSGRR